MLLTIIAFIIVLGLLIFVHEFGHFITAKRAGIKVEEFGFGFPPRLFGIKRGETIYSLNLLPIGGFVKIYGESGPEGESSQKDAKRAFYSQPAGRRAKILLAGVTMNFILAALLLGFGHWLGLPTAINGEEVRGQVGQSMIQIIGVADNSPAQAAGIKIGDRIEQLKIDGNQLQVETINQIQSFVNRYQGKEMTIVIRRGSSILEKRLVPRVEPPEGEGPLGVALVRTAIVSYPFYQAVVKGFSTAISLTWLIITSFGALLWQLITTGHLIGEIAGPVGIFNLTGQATQLGFIYILQFTAILSLHLAIINALPFPALDGGRLLFLVIEKIKGAPVSQKLERIVHTAGFVILMLLMLAITWRDIIRLF